MYSCTFYINKLLLLSLFIVIVKAEDNAVCLTHQSRTFYNLTHSNWFLKENTLDCMRYDTKQSEIFAISSPDELFLLNPDDIFVFGEIKLNENAFDKSQSTVVISSKEINIKNLNGLKYCHPGGDVTTPPWVTNEFITTILDYQEYDRKMFKNETLLDYSYYVLNSTLGPSCLRNVWSDDENLKIKYPKLFALCARYNPEYNAFEQSLRCLINGDGDIAVTSLEMMHELEQEILSGSKELFSYCKNNTWQKLNNPCLWRTTSWPVLIGNKNNSERLPEIVNALKYFSPFPNSISLSNYIKGFNDNSIFNTSNLTFSTKQNRILSWCTITKEEYENCLLLQKIFSSYDIPIRITSCVKAEADYLDKYECIKTIKKGVSSATFLHSDLLFTAKRSNLKVAVYANTGQNVIKSILLVDSTEIKSIDDLKNKNGCFSDFASIDWFSFVSAYKSKILKTSCFYDEELSKFLGDSCMPGVRDDFRMAKESVDLEHVCGICEASSRSPTAVNCNSDQDVNIFATSNGAMDCLKKSVSQFAVVRIDNNFNISSNNITQDVKVMCKNGTLLDFNNIDDECYLSITPYGGIVSTANLVEDVKLAFTELKLRNLKYGWLPREYVSNLFTDLFPVKSITDLVSVESCDKTDQSDFCKHTVKLDHMIEGADSCLNDKPAPKQSDSIGIIVGVVLLCLVLVGAAIGYKVYQRYQNRENNNETQLNTQEESDNREISGNETENDPLNRQN